MLNITLYSKARHCKLAIKNQLLLISWGQAVELTAFFTQQIDFFKN